MGFSDIEIRFKKKKSFLLPETYVKDFCFCHDIFSLISPFRPLFCPGIEHFFTLGENILMRTLVRASLFKDSPPHTSQREGKSPECISRSIVSVSETLIPEKASNIMYDF